MSNLADNLLKVTSIADVEKLSATPFRIANYIAGAFVESESYLASVSPQTERHIFDIPDSTATEATNAVKAAHDSFSSWSGLTRAERSGYMSKVASLIRKHAEAFAVCESFDQGKTVERAKMEVERAAQNFEYFATYVSHETNASRMIDNVALTYEHRSPLGPFILISPWNLPLYLLTWKIAPCLSFGCTAVAKPSEVTSLTAFLLASIMHLANIPSGVINFVFGTGFQAGAALVRNPLIKGISFTGGTVTGTKIKEQVARSIGLHISLELGGKNPTIIFNDAMATNESITKTVQLAARAAFSNQGEICLCGSRIYVQQESYKQFLDEFKKHVLEEYKPGTTLGPVVSKQHYDKVISYIKLAQREGEILFGGPDRVYQKGYYIQPTAAINIPNSSRVIQEEVFGPFVTINAFGTKEHAVELANDNVNGLAAVLVTNDINTMRFVSERIDSGLVWVNCWMVRELGTPFGGMKQSGEGREGGEYSRDVFTKVRTIHVGQ